MSAFMEAAKEGDVDSMYSLSYHYYNGSGGVAQDYGEALAWAGKAAAKGNSRALFMLGIVHQSGHGTPVNLLNALYYYKQARDKGCPVDCTPSIAGVEAAIAADPALRAAATAVAAMAEQRAFDGALFQHEKARVQQQDAANVRKEAKLQRREAANRQMEDDLKTQQEALEVERVRLEHLEETLQRERNAFDAIMREQEAEQRVKEAAAATFAKAKKDAAAAKQAEILEERHAEGSNYIPARDAVAAAWEPTKVKLADCPVHAGPLAPGQSVLLEKCLHTICRKCVPHMIQPDNSVRCPVCQVESSLKDGALPHHPLIEAELVAVEIHDCEPCKANPIDQDGAAPATFKCTGCSPAQLYCEAHSVRHRVKAPAHVMTPLPHGDAASRCSIHGKPTEVYCLGCRKLICMACFTTNHSVAEHAVRLLTDTGFVDSVRARLVEGVAIARTVAEALIDHAADATVAVTELNERDAAIGSEIDRTINVLAGLLERRREAAHDARLAHTSDERAGLQKAREESEHYWRIITSAADLAEQLAEGTHLGVNATAVMVQLEEAATARLRAVLELAPELGIPAPAILRFHFDESLAEQLTSLGEVHLA